MALPNLPLVYLDGKFLPPAEAKVSVFDRGFLFGDGVYEVVPVFCGRLFRLPHHLTRLEASLREIRLPNPHTGSEWQVIFERLIKANRDGDQSVYLQITRGVAPRDHAFVPDPTPTVFAYAWPITFSPPEQIANGVSAITAEDIRWSRCDIKSIALLGNAMLRTLAVDAGAAETILVRDGQVTEGSASNIFIVSGGRIVTPPKGRFILPGITRDLVVELAHANGIPCAEEAISEEQLFAADEVWMTSSTKEVLAITRVNDRPIGTGRPGPMHARLFGLYRDYKRAFCEGRVS